VDLVARVLDEGVAAVCEQAGVTTADIQQAFFGLPGYGEVSADVPLLDAAPAKALGHHRYRCDNDMVCGWAGSLGATDGINVISGTGSMSYGEHAGARVRVGGWGELFGDEGSGHWIAVRGLQIVSQMSDGRLPPGPLLDLMRDHLGLQRDSDLAGLVLHRWHSERKQVAALSRVVVRAAEEGDASSLDLLAEAAVELMRLVDVARKRLAFANDEVVAVSYSGGVFGTTVVLDRFQHELGEASVPYELRKPLYSPAVGAALYAAKISGTPLDGVARQRLLASAACGKR
jgi:N-acetylglucosamine kinase-like BadF-type ATPase